jgi:SAM-dependent methyltransferase/methyltransferase-like protein
VVAIRDDAFGQSGEQGVPGYGPSSYEVVPYKGRPTGESHPDTLASIATLFGMKPPSVPHARVLEIGCARGENLVPMAAALPGGRFLGIDSSQRQVAEARATSEAAGLENIELRQMDLLQAGPDLGTFDYIVCHGVFSWVAPEVRQAILSLIAATLAPSGLAYVSYNTYPGWHMREIVRGAMLFHTDGEFDPREGIRKGREVLDFLVQLPWGPENYYLTMVQDLRTAILKEDGAYLLHEFLEETNQPFYYHEFLERVAARRLKAVADAEFFTNACMASEPIRAAIAKLSQDPARQEQYFDLLHGRPFRRTILCHEGVESLPGPSEAAVEGLQAALKLRPGSLSPGFSAVGSESISDGRGQPVTIDHPVVKAAVGVLGEQYPGALPFGDLWRMAIARLTDAGLSPSEYGAVERRRLARFLLQGYGAGWLELHSHVPSFVREPGERPATTRLALHQARAGEQVVNLRHELVDLSRFDRHLLELLDGNRTLAALVDALDALVIQGALTIRGSDPGPSSAAARRAIVAESLRQGLARLASRALLVS